MCYGKNEYYVKVKRNVHLFLLDLMKNINFRHISVVAYEITASIVHSKAFPYHYTNMDICHLYHIHTICNFSLVLAFHEYFSWDFLQAVKSKSQLRHSINTA